MKCCYYDENSFREWCHEGNVLLMQFRQKQQELAHKKSQQQQHHRHRHRDVIVKKHPHRKSSNIKRSAKDKELASNLSRNDNSRQHEKEKDSSHTSEHVRVLFDDDDDEEEEEEESPPLDDDDDDGIAILNDNEPTNEMPVIARTSVEVNPTNSTEQELIQSPPSITTSMKRKIRSSDHLNGYYDENSFREWCHEGNVLLIQFRQKQQELAHKKSQQQHYHHRHRDVIVKKHPHCKSSNIKRSAKDKELASNHSRKENSRQHKKEKDSSRTSEHVVVLFEDDDEDDEEEESPIGLLDDDDDGGIAILNDNEPTNEMPVIARTSVEVNSTNTTEQELIQSPPSITTSMKRKIRSSDHLNDITLNQMAKKKKTKKNVFSAKSNAVLNTMASKRSTPKENTKFIVKDTPPQFIALVEGICTATTTTTTSKDTSMSKGTESYYTSERYHYLLDIVDHGQYHRLPKHGYATELPSVSPVAPGPWMVQMIQKKSNDFTTVRLQQTTFFRNHQADWNGYRIRLVHTDFQLRIPQSIVKDNGDWSNDFTTIRIDPNRYRVSHNTNDSHSDDCDDNYNNDDDDGNHPQAGEDSFIGAMGIVMFDGFACVSESEALQASLAEVVLNKLRQILHENENDEVYCKSKQTPIIPSFTTIKSHSIPMECTSGNGGIVIPINIGCKSIKSSDKFCVDNDYFILLVVCEATNQVVAIDVVFDNVFAICSNGKKYLKGSKESPTTDSTRTPSLTQQNLQNHTSKWSTLNMLQHLGKKKDPQSPADGILEEMSETMVLDEWTPHDEEFVAHTAHDNDDGMNVVWDHDENESSKPNRIIFEKVAVTCVPSKEESKCVPQEDRIVVATDLPAVTPLILNPFFTTNENSFTSSLHHESQQVSMMMNQVTPTPMQDQSNSMHLTILGQTSQDWKCKSLFPESCKAKDDCTIREDVTIAFPSTNLKVTPSTPTVLHCPTSSCSADKEDNTTTKHPPVLSPSKSTVSTFLDCHQSMSSDLALNEDENFFAVITDEIVDELDNVEHLNAQVDGDTELLHETMSMVDILFFEFQNADTVSEMSLTDVAIWCECQQALIDQLPIFDSSLHDALFGGLIVLDLEREQETFTHLLWHNWAIPMFTLLTAMYMFSSIAMKNQFLIDLLRVTDNSLIRNDPSQGLLAPLMFVDTNFGYVGTVCIE